MRDRDILKSEGYAAKSTVYPWLKRWSEESVLDTIRKQLLSVLEAEDKLDLREGSLYGSSF